MKFKFLLVEDSSFFSVLNAFVIGMCFRVSKLERPQFQASIGVSNYAAKCHPDGCQEITITQGIYYHVEKHRLASNTQEIS